MTISRWLSAKQVHGSLITTKVPGLFDQKCVFMRDTFSSNLGMQMSIFQRLVIQSWSIHIERSLLVAKNKSRGYMGVCGYNIFAVLLAKYETHARVIFQIRIPGGGRGKQDKDASGAIIRYLFYPISQDESYCAPPTTLLFRL